jgi:hypothetical protein
VWFFIFLVIPFAIVILFSSLHIWAIHNKVLGAPTIVASSLFLVGKLLGKSVFGSIALVRPR